MARWYFRVGAAAGSVAKTMSAYDMQVSDDIYGQAGRYVSRERLDSMLNKEYALFVNRLKEKRGHDTRFFAFCNTVPAQAELQFGMNVNKNVALYVDAIVGVGGDKLFDWGVGTGLRIKY